MDVGEEVMGDVGEEGWEEGMDQDSRVEMVAGEEEGVWDCTEALAMRGKCSGQE